MGVPQPKQTLKDWYYERYPEECPLEEKKEMSTDDLIRQYRAQTEMRMTQQDAKLRTLEITQTTLSNNLESSINALIKQMQMLETQISQLANAQGRVEDLGDGSNSEVETDETKDEGPKGEVLGRATGRAESRSNPVPAETCDFFSDGFSLRYLFDPTPDEESIQPPGVVEDVRVRRFDFLAEFVIVEMEEDVKQSLILGHPFLATSGDCFDMESGDLPVRVHKEELKISVLGAKRRKLEDGGEKRFHFYPP